MTYSAKLGLIQTREHVETLETGTCLILDSNLDLDLESRSNLKHHKKSFCVLGYSRRYSD